MFERCIFGEVIAPCVPHAGSTGGVLNSEPELPLSRYYALHDLQFHSRWELFNCITLRAELDNVLIM